MLRDFRKAGKYIRLPLVLFQVSESRRTSQVISQKWRICKFHFVILHFYVNKKKTKKIQAFELEVLVLESIVGEYKLVRYIHRCTLIRTVIFSPLQHKQKQKYTDAKNRISIKFIAKVNKETSIQHILHVLYFVL